jgi:hypothetical protein
MKKVIEFITLFLTNLGRATTGRKPIPDDPHAEVTRFEVIDYTKKHRGRILVEYKVSVEVSIQDEGRTMKIFLTDKK